MKDSNFDKNLKELEELYEIYKKIVANLLKNPRFTDEYGKRVTVDSEMYKILVGYYHFDKFPQIIEDDVYNKLNQKEIYHGFTDYEHGAELLSHFNYNFGVGGYTPGLFFTDFKDVATWYTNHEVEGLDENGERVLNVKIAPNSKGMNFKNLQDLIISPVDDLPKNLDSNYKEKIQCLEIFKNSLKEKGENPNGFLKTMKRTSNFAVYLGLDYLFEETYNHTIIFNRNAMCVSEDLFNKFCDNSTHFKTGFFDFFDVYKNNYIDNQKK